LVNSEEFFADMLPEMCETVTIEVIEYNSDKLKCPEGTCLSVVQSQMWTDV